MLKHKGKEAVNSLYFCIILPFCDAINLYRKIRDTFRKIGIQLSFFFSFFFLFLNFATNVSLRFSDWKK